jgi:hypothetical protein
MKMFPAFLALMAALVPMLRAGDATKQLEPVHFSKLIPLLPAAPSGWTARDPEGSTMDAAGFKMTTVERAYAKGEAENAPSVSVNIIDCASNKQFHDATTAMWSFSQESTEGYMRSVGMDGNPGFETYDKNNRSGQLWVVVGQRFFVHIETTNLDPAELQAWMKWIDLKKLAALK